MMLHIHISTERGCPLEGHLEGVLPTPILYLLHGTPYYRCPWGLNSLDTVLLNHLLWYSHFSLWGGGEMTKKDD